jgi:PAS domain S-box-containing protein
LLLADNDVCEKLRGEIQEAGYSYVYVMANTSKMLFHAVAGLVRAHRVEGTLRSVNQRLVEVVEDHARAMHESEELYRFLFNACSDAIMVLEVDRNGANGVLKEVNEVAVKWFGYVRDHGAEFSLKQLFSFSNHNKASNKVDSILKRKEMFFETMMQRKDGTKIPVEVITRTFALEGERYRVIILARLFDHSTPGQGRTRPAKTTVHGFPDRIADVRRQSQNAANDIGRAVAEITGYPAQQIMRLGMKGWRERIVSEDYHRVVATINHATRKLDKYEVEYRIVHKSGDIRYIEDHGVVLPDESALRSASWVP